MSMLEGPCAAAALGVAKNPTDRYRPVVWLAEVEDIDVLLHGHT